MHALHAGIDSIIVTLSRVLVHTTTLFDEATLTDLTRPGVHESNAWLIQCMVSKWLLKEGVHFQLS
jgi:hypothetical protein